MQSAPFFQKHLGFIHLHKIELCQDFRVIATRINRLVRHARDLWGAEPDARPAAPRNRAAECDLAPLIPFDSQEIPKLAIQLVNQ
jgi:hypothetical protein